MKVNYYTHILRKGSDLQYRQYWKKSIQKATDSKRQIIKGNLKDKEDELRGSNVHLIGVPEER